MIQLPLNLSVLIRVLPITKISQRKDGDMAVPRIWEKHREVQHNLSRDKRKTNQLLDPVGKSHRDHKWWKFELLGKRSRYKAWRSDRSYRSRHFTAFLWLRIPGGKRSQGSLEEKEILLQPINSPDPKLEVLGLAQFQGPVERNQIPLPGSNHSWGEFAL